LTKSISRDSQAW